MNALVIALAGILVTIAVSSFNARRKPKPSHAFEEQRRRR